MGVVVGAHQSVDADVGIDLSRRQAGISQQLLDIPYIHTPIKQIKHKCVTDHVQMHVLASRRPQKLPVQNSPHATRRQPSAALIQKERPVVLQVPTLTKEDAALRNPCPDRLTTHFVHGDLACLAALAGHPDPTLREVDNSHVAADELANA